MEIHHKVINDKMMVQPLSVTDAVNLLQSIDVILETDTELCVSLE